MKKISRFLSVAVLCCGLLANGAVAYANEISPNSFEYSARDCAARPLKLSIHSGGIEHACRRR